ncbi:MAG: glycosyltransferase family 4 protein [Firmicutes bacterium]|nr:glycosyltransferase family 4 protein [Bacillota bacterium]
MKYYLIGPYPPPLGGVSVYVYRYVRILNARGQEAEIIDLSKKSKLGRLFYLLKWIFDPREAIFHLNVFDFYAMIALTLRPFKGKIIFQDHSAYFLESIGGMKRIILKFFLKKVDECVLVGEHLRAYYQQYGYKLPDKTHIRHAFLPPPLEDESRIWRTYDAETLRFVESHKPLIIANAFQITFYRGVDLYGLDMCIALVAALKKEHPKIGLLFALAAVGNEKYFDAMNRRIYELGIQENFHFMTGQKELWPLFRKADLMVRPTCTDGYGISVAEALYFKCPAVASNVCQRAEGTVLFESRNQKDFLDKVRELL